LSKEEIALGHMVLVVAKKLGEILALIRVDDIEFIRNDEAEYITQVHDMAGSDNHENPGVWLGDLLHVGFVTAARMHRDNIPSGTDSVRMDSRLNAANIRHPTNEFYSKGSFKIKDLKDSSILNE
jgi:hypothetical protein